MWYASPESLILLPLFFSENFFNILMSHPMIKISVIGYVIFK